jgi:hypothetical protein
MADALAANWSGQEETVEAKCLAHARRKFIDIERAFPVECGRMLNAIAKVYQVEAETKGMSAQERLECHQARSGPVMAELREWIEEEFSERRTEPNSGLGQAFRYVLRHWEGLTRFLTVAGVPLDNPSVSGKGTTLPPRPPLRTDRAGCPGNQLKPFQRSFQNAVSPLPTSGDGLPGGIPDGAIPGCWPSRCHREIAK